MGAELNQAMRKSRGPFCVRAAQLEFGQFLLAALVLAGVSAVFFHLQSPAIWKSDEDTRHSSLLCERLPEKYADLNWMLLATLGELLNHWEGSFIDQRKDLMLVN